MQNISPILLTAAVFFISTTPAAAYDSETLVDTNNTSTSTSTVNSTTNSTTTNTSTVNSTNTNINQNINSGTTTVNNNNVNSGTMTYNNNNVNTGDMTNRNINTSTSTSTSVNTNNNINTGDMTNRNINTSTSTATNNNVNQNVNTGDMTNRNINSSDITQRVIQPPPTAIAPAMMSGGNNDLCTTGSSSAVQTQVLGVSAGTTVRDMNCERLKLSKTLFDMGMKVAAVATMCQDRRVFDAMMQAGTPCPYNGMIGQAARDAWEENPHRIPKYEEPKTDDVYKKMGFGALLGAGIWSLFGF